MSSRGAGKSLTLPASLGTNLRTSWRRPAVAWGQERDRALRPGRGARVSACGLRAVGLKRWVQWGPAGGTDSPAPGAAARGGSRQGRFQGRDACGRRGPGAEAGPRAGARGALTSCSAQRQISEQRPVQQPMVPAASERRSRPEIRVLRLRCLLTPEQSPPGARQARPAAAARSCGGLGSRTAFVSFPGGQRSVPRAPAARLAGALPPTVRVCFLGKGSRAGGREATAGEWVEVCLGEGSLQEVGV